MLTPQFNLDLNDKLIIVNFAGGGGSCTGIEMGLGRNVDVAINHDEKAIAMHRANHPQTRHYCESVWDVDPLEVTSGRPVGLVWLSPDCKHFSKAKGGKPVEKKIRGLAWITLRWADLTKPDVIMLENVEEFQTWGPLDPHGKPIKEQKGREFNAFKNALKRHGYVVEHRELRACDYGSPTIRKRFFMIARRDGLPIIWPEPTHGDPKASTFKQSRLKPWLTAADCIDWTIPCPSIFERKKDLAEATQRRVAKGVMRYVIDAKKPFIVTMAHGEGVGKTKRWGSGVRDVDLPLPTLTSSGGYGIVAPVITEHANASNPRSWAADTPLRTQCAQVKGGHFALVSAFLAKHYTGVVGSEIEKPVGSITTIDHHSLVTSNIVKMRGDNIGQAVDEPLHTISAGGTHHAEVRAFLLKYYGTDQNPILDDPLHTVTTKERFALVTVKGETFYIADIGLRMLHPKELFAAQGFPDTYIIDKGVSIDKNGNLIWIELTKTDQVRMAGNSVCPPLASALALANLGYLSIKKAA